MKSLTCLAGLAAVSLGFSQPILDGTRDGSYSLRSVQTVETGFVGSELDAAWAQIQGNTLYLVLTGNLDNNFSRLNLFFDSVAGGENQITSHTGNGGNNPGNDDWAIRYAGYTFDTGFAADYMLTLRSGNSGGNRFDIDYAIVGGGAGAFETGGDVFGGSLTGANLNALSGAGIGVAFNNSNVGGVLGGSNAANQAAAQAVTTGIELAIPLAALGNPLGDIKISAHINATDHAYLSNQSLGGYAPPQINLGADGHGGFTGFVGQLDMNDFAGNQWFSVQPVPEPATVTVLALAGLGLLRRRKR